MLLALSVTLSGACVCDDVGATVTFITGARTTWPPLPPGKFTRYVGPLPFLDLCDESKCKNPSCCFVQGHSGFFAYHILSLEPCTGAFAKAPPFPCEGAGEKAPRRGNPPRPRPEANPPRNTPCLPWSLAARSCSKPRRRYSRALISSNPSCVHVLSTGGPVSSTGASSDDASGTGS